MALEHDFMVESIEEMIHMIYLNLFRNSKEDILEKTYKEKNIIDLVEDKNINKAEDIIYDKTDFNNLEDIEKILLFYRYLNSKDSEYLQDCNYTREEIKDGVKEVAKKCGLETLMILFK